MKRLPGELRTTRSRGSRSSVGPPMTDCCEHGDTEHDRAHARHDRISSHAPRLVFKVSGLDCAEEVSILRRAVGPLVGGEDNLAFDVLNGRMMILEGALDAGAEPIRQAVARTGMSAVEWRPGIDDSGEAEQRRRLQVWFTALSGALVVTGIAIHVWLAGSLIEAWRLFAEHGAAGMPWPELGAYALATAVGLRFVLPRAWSAAKRMQPDMHLLMTIAVLGAIGIGEWFEAATVAFLFALSLALENWSVARARRAISALLDLAPPNARIKGPGGTEREVAASEVAVGTHFIVKPGERLPLDGRIVAGSSSVNQAPITGESMPVAKQPGADVFAGTINGDGALEVESTKAAEDTTLARVIKMVEQAHAKRAPSEQWVEKFARIYTPANQNDARESTVSNRLCAFSFPTVLSSLREVYRILNTPGPGRRCHMRLRILSGFALAAAAASAVAAVIVGTGMQGDRAAIVFSSRRKSVASSRAIAAESRER